MVQLLKSTRHFELFLRRNPGTVRVSTENSKHKVILGRCAIFRPATAEFRIISVTSAHFWPLRDRENCDALANSHHLPERSQGCVSPRTEQRYGQPSQTTQTTRAVHA